MSGTFDILGALREQGQAELGCACRILVGMGTCGQAAGAREVLDALTSTLADLPNALDAIRVESVGCKGLCFAEPLVELRFAAAEPVLFGHMDAAKAHELACWASDALGENASTPASDANAPIVPDALAAHIVDQSVLAGQERRVMSNCGEIAPTSLAQYVARGGYSAIQTALSMPPNDVIASVEAAGLRGRGGAGFPTGAKWRACAEAVVDASDNADSGPNADADANAENASSSGTDADANAEKAASPNANAATDADSTPTSTPSERYFIVNGDEGDPGAYMDRGLLESDPHRVIEGLIIGCWATGVHQAYFFIRAEYPLAVRTVRAALEDAREAGLIGNNILGSGFNLHVDVVRGAGAFLCGESTAMINVLENGECTTRPKPPHMTQRGLWGKPTCINNVETLACVPLIVQNGAAWFRSVGTEESPGTKVFSVTGAVERGGLAEVPLGTPFDEVLNRIAGARDPKAVQIGGPSGAIIPANLDGLEVSFEGLSGINGMMGSGGFVVISHDQCVVDTASYLVHFSARQSCRKCRACRDGLDECAAIFERITQGQGSSDDLDRLQQIAQRNCASKLCGLGRTSLSPVLSSLHYFRGEYEEHLRGCCPGLTCQALVSYAIDQKKCQGERCCLLTCPGNAVKGSFGKPGRIVGRLCQKCGMCVVSCPYAAVYKVSPAVP